MNTYFCWYLIGNTIRYFRCSARSIYIVVTTLESHSPSLRVMYDCISSTATALGKGGRSRHMGILIFMTPWTQRQRGGFFYTVWSIHKNPDMDRPTFVSPSLFATVQKKNLVRSAMLEVGASQKNPTRVGPGQKFS